MNSTWEARDLPVLKAIVEIEDDTRRHVKETQVAAATGLDAESVQRALAALGREDPPFFELIDASSMGGAYYLGAVNCTGHARRTVGAWPTADVLADRILVALEDVAANSPSEEARGTARRLLDSASGVGKGVLTGVLVNVLSGQVG
jgi:hypothetical protein